MLTFNWVKSDLLDLSFCCISHSHPLPKPWHKPTHSDFHDTSYTPLAPCMTCAASLHAQTTQYLIPHILAICTALFMHPVCLPWTAAYLQKDLNFQHHYLKCNWVGCKFNPITQILRSINEIHIILCNMPINFHYCLCLALTQWKKMPKCPWLKSHLLKLVCSKQNYQQIMCWNYSILVWN